MIHATKRSHIGQPPRSSKSTIDNLPDFLLVEIFCRLPHNKVVFRCKCISKRWRTLLSDPYFINRFLRIQHDQQRPLLNQYVMIPIRFAKHKAIVLTMSSEPPPPLIEANISSIFSFLPCFQGHEYAEKGDSLYVPATYNDLVLCSPTKTSQRDYYICNSYTKEWIRLPPTHRIYSGDLVSAGFICEPFYNIKEDGTSSNSSIIKLNTEYRFKVVRLLPNQDYNGFYVEIYSSETGEWREYPSSSILCQQRLYNFYSPSVACNGKLYWLNHSGSLFELDPFSMCSTSDVIDKCRFIDSPTPDVRTSNFHIGVCRGRLQMCPFSFHSRRCDTMAIWELKENEVDGKPEWCLLHQLSSLSEMVPKQPLSISSFHIVGFHPIYRDIVYLEHSDVYSDEPRYIVMCNVRERTLETAAKIPFENSHGVPWVVEGICPYVIPWWPTPVQARLNYREEHLNITVIGVDTFTVKVGCLISVKQLKQKLEEEKGHEGQYELLHFDGRVLEDDDKWLTDYGIKDKSVIYVDEHCWKEWLML